MADVAALGFAIDSSEAVQASGNLDRMSNASKRAEQAADQLGKSNRQSGTEAQRAAAQYNQQTLNLDKHAAAQARVQKELAIANAALRTGVINQEQYAERAKLIDKNLGHVTESVRTQRMQMRALAEAFGNSGSEMASLINRSGLLYLAMNHISVAAVALVFTLGTVALAVRQVFTIWKQAADIANSAKLSNLSGQDIQGLIAAGGFKGVSSDEMLKSMVDFNKQVEQAKHGLGDLATLFRVNNIQVTSTEEAFFKVADLVMKARNEAEKFSIIQQAGLPVTNQMVLLLEQGGDQIRRQADEAKKLNDAQLHHAKELEDRWLVMWTNFERWGKSALLNTIEFFKIEVGPGFFERIRAIGDMSANSRVAEGFGAMGGPLKVTVGAKPGGTVDPALMKQQLELEKQRILVLGQLQTMEQQVRAAEIDLAIAGINNAGVTKKQHDAIINLVRTQAEWARINQQSAIGVFDLAKATEAAGHELKSWIDLKLIDPNNALQMAAAHQVLAEKIRATAEAAALAATPFKQLKQFELDARNLDKQLDMLAVSGLNSVTTGLTDMAMGTVSVKEGFRSLGLSVIRAIEEMIIKMTIVLPLAKALQSALGFGFGSGSLGGPVGWQGPPQAMGNAFDRGNIIPFARGGIVNGPTLFPMAKGVSLMGEAGPEAIMPLRRGPGGELGVRGGGGGGIEVHIHQDNKFYGADPGSEARLKGALLITKEQAKNEAMAAIEKRWSNEPAFMRRRAG